MTERHSDEAFPVLPWTEWQDTCATLQLWTQVVGKVRLALAPPCNHWWHVPLYVTARGLTTSAIPYGRGNLQIDFDFLGHTLTILTSAGAGDSIALQPQSVAEFYAQVMECLRSLDVPVVIRTMPVEIPNPIPFDLDDRHAAYDPLQVQRFFHMLVRADNILKEFRGRFLGKASPVHFFWGSFDLAVTRFSGRPAPHHPSVPDTPDKVTQEAYSHEVSSCGFWPGGAAFPQPAFYSYAYPEPPGFAQALAAPGYYSPEMGEFVLPCADVRTDSVALDFLETTYRAAAEKGGWDRQKLESSNRN